MSKKGTPRPDMVGNSLMKGRHHSEMTKELIRVHHTNQSGANHPMWGKKHSEESKQKTRLTFLMKSPEEKLARKIYSGSMRGRHHSEMTKKKISESHKGKKKTLEHCKNISLSKSTPESLERFKLRRSKIKIPFKDSKIELKLQELLNALNIKYQKHFPVYHPDMGYHQVDIMICDHEGNPKIAIECDGCYWHGCPIHFPTNNIERVKRDWLINYALTQLGIKIIRFWEHDINLNMIRLELLNQ